MCKCITIINKNTYSGVKYFLKKMYFNRVNFVIYSF